MDVKTRIDKYIDFKGISISSFEKSIGCSNGYWRNTKSISANILSKIANTYPDLSIDWVVTEKGSIFKSNKNESIKDRLRVFIEYHGLTEPEFYTSIKIPSTRYHEIEEELSEKEQREIQERYPSLNLGWLITGNGPMLKSYQTPRPEERMPITGNTIKYYPSVNGSMGGIEFLDNPEEFYTDIVLPGFSECKFAVNAFGDSMYPVIKSGQIVIMMPWTERFIDWGHIYMVVTKSGYRAIKYLKPSSKEGCITCESENKENSPAFDVNMEDIHKLYLVKGWICRDAI